MDIREPKLTITLGGKERPFRYSFASFAQLLERYESVEEPFSIASRFLGHEVDGKRLFPRMTKIMLEAIVDVVHAGLLEDPEKPSRDEVIGWLDQENIPDVFVMIFKARGIALPDPKEIKNPQKLHVQNGRGAISSRKPFLWGIRKKFFGK